MLRQSAIIVGPISSGKRHVASYIGGEMRKQLTLDECVDWALSAAGKKNKLRGAGAENASVIEEMIKLLEVQEGDGEAMGGKRSRVAVACCVPTVYNVCHGQTAAKYY